MPKKRDGFIPLPSGWDVDTDFDGKQFFIDHNTKITTWVDPRDRYTKPQSFADCVGDELPYGWEEAHDPQVGVYYINHINHTNQLEDPRLMWRDEQERMLKEYLVHANDDLAAKKEIYSVKQKRLAIAQEEVSHLKDTLAGWKASRTSLNSSASCTSTKYDPDLLKADVALAKTRVARIKRELEQIHKEVAYKERGLQTLSQIDQKMQTIAGFTVDQAQEYIGRIKNIKKSLHSGEKEKQELVQSLARLNNEFLRSKLTGGSSPDVSTLSIPTEKICTASQTDLTGENVGGSQLGEMLKLRMRYDMAKKDVAQLQQQLAVIEQQIIPGEAESDKDRLLLIQEKEQLLRELRGVNLKGKDEQEASDILQQIASLEQDLKAAMELSSKQIAERLKLNDEKKSVLEQLAEAVRHTSYLETQLKSMSMSTLSVSSGSSRGSLGSLSASSSKGSLNSLGAISFTDIYGQTQLSTPSDPNLQDLYLRVEKSLQGHSVSPIQEVTVAEADYSESVPATSGQYLSVHGAETPYSLGSSHSSLSPPVSPFEISVPPPSYEQHIERHRHVPVTYTTPPDCGPVSVQVTEMPHGQPPDYSANHSTSATVALPQARIVPSIPLHTESSETVTTSSIAPNMSRRTLHAADSSERINNPPLSPISETSSGMCNNVSGGNTRSVSAAVSDESVAGDSGVFEASGKRSGDLDEVFSIEAAQVQIKLKYDAPESKLHIGIEQARNLSALTIPENCKVCLKASLVPMSKNIESSFTTSISGNTNNPKFNEFFKVPSVENKLSSKTLQVSVWCVHLDGEQDQECLGSAQVSLADFDSKRVSLKWYNVLSFKFMQEAQRSKSSSRTSVGQAAASVENNDKIAQLLEESSERLRQASVKEGNRSSSFEGASAFRSGQPTAGAPREESSDESTIISSQTSTLTRNQGPEDMDSHKEDYGAVGAAAESSESQEDEEVELALQGSDVYADDTLEEEEDDEEDFPDGTIKIVTVDAETNTESILSRQRRRLQQEENKSGTIKRSQTFSPAARVEEDRICKLNRSDSDSSVPKYCKAPFKRNSLGRRSMRWKQSPLHLQATSHSRSKSEAQPKYTSLDLEMDLKASETRLAHLNEELARLKELKLRLEQARTNGGKQAPSWLSENEDLQQFLMDASSQGDKKDKVSRRADHLLRKAKKEAIKMQKQQADAKSFREKMVFLTSANLSIPVVPAEGAAEGDDVRLVSKSSTPMQV